MIAFWYNTLMNIPELLAPAGNSEKLPVALRYGADAVYLGGEQFSLRALAGNFDRESLRWAVAYAHGYDLQSANTVEFSGQSREAGQADQESAVHTQALHHGTGSALPCKKVYVALNIIPHDDELTAIPEYVRFLEAIGADGVIVSDPGVFETVREHSELPIHISTQANNANWKTVQMWQKLGVKRVTLARELSLDEMRVIRDRVPDVELEAFIHGAMCMAVSGRCLLSNYLAGRDANRGECAQACRWHYTLQEETRPGEHFPVFEDGQNSYILNSRDLCTIDFFNSVLDIGLDSLKIEGRMKSIHYAAVTTRVYREAIDRCGAGGDRCSRRLLNELQSVSNRGFTPGFYLGKPGSETHDYSTSTPRATAKLVAKVIKSCSDGTCLVEIRNKIIAGETVEHYTPQGPSGRFKWPVMIHPATREPLTEVNPVSLVYIKTTLPLHPLDLIRAVRS